MVDETVEFQISQYVDGTLSAEDVGALEERLASDPEARQMLGEYRRLQKHLVASLAVPGLNWDRLADRLSRAVTESGRPAVAGRIGPRSWVMDRRLAIAASVLIAIGAGLLVHRGFHSAGQPLNKAGEFVAVVKGPEAEPAGGPVVQQIVIGPSPALAARGDSWRYAEGVVTRPSHVELAGEMHPPADGNSHIH